MKRSILLYPPLWLLAVLSVIGCASWFFGFHLNTKIVSLHLLWVLNLHLLFVSITLLLSKKSWKIRWLLSATYLSFLVLFYALVAWSVKLWGDIITLKIIATYLADFNGFLKSVGISKVLFAAIVFIYLLLIFGALFFSRKWLFYSPPKISTKSLWMFVIGSLLLAIFTKRFFHKQGEPSLMFSFDRMWGLTENPFFSANRIAVGKSDQAIFADYISQYRLQKSNQKNVVLIICDALRADHLPIYGYPRNTSPFLNELYQKGAVKKIDYCITTSASTTCGIPSLFLSRNWNDCSVNGFNLFKLLHFSGFKTHAIIAGAHREWYNLAKFYTDDCDFYFDGKNSKNFYFKDDRVVLEGLKEALARKKQPSFFYLHFQSPHQTALLRDSFKIYKPDEKELSKEKNYTSLINKYDNKIVQVDDAIRAVFKLLAEQEMLENTVIFITADHGEGLGEHGVEGHVDWLYQPQISVPLLVYGDTMDYTNTRFARQIDIVPTIAERLGLAIPASWQGKSLISHTPSHFSFHETGKNNLETNKERKAVIDYSESAIYKLIFTTDPSEDELYELISDPSELNNIAIKNKERVKKMRAAFR